MNVLGVTKNVYGVTGNVTQYTSNSTDNRLIFMKRAQYKCIMVLNVYFNRKHMISSTQISDYMK